MRENIAERLLIIFDSLGLKAISTEEVVLPFIGYSIGGGHQPSTGSTNPTSQAEICSGTSLRAVKESSKCWDGEVSTSF